MQNTILVTGESKNNLTLIAYLPRAQSTNRKKHDYK